MDADFSNDASNTNMLVAPVTPNRMLSPETTLPPPAPRKRRILSKDWENDLPLFPDLSGESMTDDSVHKLSLSTSALSLTRRSHEDDDDMDMIFLTPCQPRQSPLDSPKLGIQPRVTSQCQCQPVEAHLLPMLPALNPQDDPKSCTKVTIQLKLRPNFPLKQKVSLNARTA